MCGLPPEMTGLHQTSLEAGTDVVSVVSIQNLCLSLCNGLLQCRSPISTWEGTQLLTDPKFQVLQLQVLERHCLFFYQLQVYKSQGRTLLAWLWSAAYFWIFQLRSGNGVLFCQLDSYSGEHTDGGETKLLRGRMGVHISLDVRHQEREPNAEERVGKGALVICCCAASDPKLK